MLVDEYYLVISSMTSLWCWVMSQHRHVSYCCGYMGSISKIYIPFLYSPLMLEWNCPHTTPNYLEYFRVSKSTKINHMRYNHNYNIRFQDIAYLKMNKWRQNIVTYLQQEPRRGNNRALKIMVTHSFRLRPMRNTKDKT